MNCHVFQCHNKTPGTQQFMKTVEALLEYINKTLNYTKDLAQLCKDYKVPIIAQPADLMDEEQKSKTSAVIWETKVKASVKTLDEQEKNLFAIFSFIWGQCSTAMQSKLQSQDECEEKCT